MKKLSILLALVLVFSLLTACNSEEATTPDQTIPGYLIGMIVGDGWTPIEESEYDLALEKNGMQLYAYGFSPADFVDMPTAEDMFLDCTGSLLESLTDVSTVSEESTYTAGDKQIRTAMYAGKEGDTAKQFYCFMVDFGEETGNMAWVAFAAKEADMKKNKAAFKEIIDGMVCTAEPYDYESPMEDEILFDEDGNPIFEDSFTEPEDIPYEDTEPTYEVNPPEPTQETNAPAEATTAATTEATGTTEAAEATTTATTEG